MLPHPSTDSSSPLHSGDMEVDNDPNAAAEAEMMNTAVRIFLQKLHHRRICARGFHQFDLRIRQLDIRHAHALFGINFNGTDLQAVFLFKPAGGGIQIGNHDGNMTDAGEHK